ncbi:hypothetical protein CAI21_04825 [Alkalilimnicola ehrlichii]|uniref:Uncharacterized protein n=1 Tax=Alkalilimnicola ehrlichii TaxID=351052 RepID=A0A3E0WZX1_9GAMM|nr:DUF1800 family protein [Alkalilimnicola ehrlichii]RFA30826.1 hypothetical protein CAI21_04825 [Alkalilimnicola ehrlichii]RFA38404.1 hypothetical protein CAL65_06190 [Alkalilimnicola ehrlichii]
MRYSLLRWRGLVVVLLIVLLAACGSGDKSGRKDPHGDIQLVGLTRVSDEAWDETAVRKVLHLFAYGSFASDRQIAAWADMPPERAIVEIIHVGPRNAKLSPPDNTAAFGPDGTLRGLSEYWSSPRSPLPEGRRTAYDSDAWRAPGRVWTLAATMPGLNPVRQKIGLWETNYHMAVNQGVGVGNAQIIRYYDQIMNDLAAARPYHEVIAGAAASAAVTRQYGHHNNRFRSGVFSGNEDFAREYHQLFFGILGQDDRDQDYHELVSIKNTARALTGMSYDPDDNSRLHYGSEEHYLSDLEILNTQITGGNAREKLFNLAAVAIDHPHSQENLPLMIVRTLADDNLQADSAKARALQDYWASINPKDLVTFLRGYAISEEFHSPERVKYYTSIDRNLIIANRLTLSSEERLLNFYNANIHSMEGADPFLPKHDVFGGQTGEEASTSGDVFRNAYNVSTEGSWRFERVHLVEDEEIVFTKDWRPVLPRGANGYRVEEVAEWLWQRFIADGHKHFGPLERVHVYALLARGEDPTQAWSLDPEEVISPADLAPGGRHELLFHDLSNGYLFQGTTPEVGNRNIGRAIAFIISTPYMFAQEGR